MGKAEARLDEKMRTPALLRIGHLLAEYYAEFLLRHARPGEDPLALHRFGGGDEGDRIGLPFAASLEQERDVEDDHRRVGVGGKEFVALFADERMHDALQTAQARF